MRFTVIVPTQDHQLSQLPWLLLGLRQQALGPEHWSLLLLHCGSGEALEQALTEFRSRIRDRLQIETLVLAADTPPATALKAAQQKANGDYLLFLQPGYQPHRNLLEIHQRFHQQQDTAALAIGSSQFHPEQAMTRFAMASQLDQLLFNFFPMPVTEVLPYTACQFHNLSLPTSLLPELNPELASWHFCGWELGLKLWRQGWRLQGLHEARTCLVAPLDLDTALARWLQDARQDLAGFLQAHPFPIPGWELDWPQTQADLPEPAGLEQLHQSLRQSQYEISIPIERGDAVEQALQTWKTLLRQLWRGKALQLLLNDPRRPARQRSFYPLPWRQSPAGVSLPANPVPDAALERWRSRHGAGLATLAARYTGACVETGAHPSFLSELGVPFLPLGQLPELVAALVLMTDGNFDALLRSFLLLDQHMPPRGLLALGPLTPSMRKLQRLILENYPWIELDRLEDTILLCKLGPEKSRPPRPGQDAGNPADA